MMKKRRKSFKEVFFEKVAQHMVVTIKTPPALATLKKPVSEATVAFVTTAGVRLANQAPFKTKTGDPTYREIPGDVDYASLVVNHDHYDTADASADINLVFPLAILRQMAEDGEIGQVANHHYGLMGYIPQVKPLMNKTAKQIADTMEADKVDIALLSPG